jgi:hypothetical protein
LGTGEAAGVSTFAFATMLGTVLTATSFGAATFAAFTRTFVSALLVMIKHHFCCVALHNKANANYVNKKWCSAQ